MVPGLSPRTPWTVPAALSTALHTVANDVMPCGAPLGLTFSVMGTQGGVRPAKKAGFNASSSLSVTLGGAPEDLDLLKRNRDLGIARMNVRLPLAKTDEILPLLDRWAK